MSKASVMLAAGGTGGHLFPAFALAQELGRRDIPVDLVTDMRGDRYGANFPARAVYRVPSATLASRSPIAAGRTVWMLGRGIAASYSLLGTVKPGAVVGFGGYPAFPPILAATPARHSDRPARAERRARPRQSRCCRAASRRSPPRSRTPST